ncbi:MAG: hypothetical protein A3I29_00265 [Candidatus Magasanikbacteria bacterium RIFCSPLOWO2_02_FULL_44_11]|uniref:Uncharacterized protein n=1 Tax=Candidatus Magasanikbacteria bacterium RIFCSPLOWO2_02_FULL_44_11 TaxID=1798689 RepID=A0A1F6N9B6_9BACT|nr:MAG: hypothetical protein A3I29_00265 [Candidatus Magasanikbacteria bacterium RIFCSPLOWO2_02_FULL_44_11]
MIGVVLSLSPALAGPLSNSMTNLEGALGNTGLEKDLQSTVGTVIKAVLAMVGTIFLVLTIYAGILWMTASGNDEQVTKATGIIKAAIIGLVITMSAYGITFFIASKVGGGGTQTAAPSAGSTAAPTGCCVNGYDGSKYQYCSATIGQGLCETSGYTWRTDKTCQELKIASWCDVIQ